MSVNKEIDEKLLENFVEKYVSSSKDDLNNEQGNNQNDAIGQARESPTTNTTHSTSMLINSIRSHFVSYTNKLLVKYSPK